MKKCSSCTKDLPDAALHCVFCGAKQPPAPATGPSVAKTVMGHASNEMIEQLKAQAAAAQRAPQQQQPGPAPRPSPAPPMGGGGPMGGHGGPPMGGGHGGPPMGGGHGGPPMGGGHGGPPMGGGHGGPPMGGHGGPPPMGGPMQPGPAGHGVPQAGSVAPTMFVPGGGGPPGGGFQPPPNAFQPPPPAPAFQPPPPGPQPGSAPLPPGFPNAPPMGPGPGPGPMPGLAPSPIAPAIPPYLAGRSGPRAGRPIEPWKDSLRLQMFIWGAVLLVAFLTPTAIEPGLGFNWDTIIDGEGKQKIGPLILAAVGLLSIVLAIIPTSPPPRGLLAGSLGLIGFVVPLLLTLSDGEFGLGQILAIAMAVGFMLLVIGLLLRNEYRESILPRIFVTLGVLCVLASYLIPINDDIRLVSIFKAIIDAPGKGKVGAILALLPIIYAVVSLLAWLPSPSSGAGSVMAWLWLTLFPLQHLAKLLLEGHIGDRLKASPYQSLMAWAPITGFLVLLGYGFATVIGKKLE